MSNLWIERDYYENILYLNSALEVFKILSLNKKEKWNSLIAQYPSALNGSKALNFLITHPAFSRIYAFQIKLLSLLQKSKVKTRQEEYYEFSKEEKDIYKHIEELVFNLTLSKSLEIQNKNFDYISQELIKDELKWIQWKNTDFKHIEEETLISFCKKEVSFQVKSKETTTKSKSLMNLEYNALSLPRYDILASNVLSSDIRNVC